MEDLLRIPLKVESPWQVYGYPRSNRIGQFFGCALFFLMLFLPTVEFPIKALKMVLVAVLSIGLMWQFLCGKSARSSAFLKIWTILVVSTGVFFVTFGLINETPGAIRVSTVYVFWPLVYFLLIHGIRGERTVIWLFRMMLLALFLTVPYALGYALNAYGAKLGDYFVDLYPIERQGIDFEEGYMRVSIRQVSSLLFVVPFLTSSILIGERATRSLARRWVIWAALFGGIILVIITARKALMLVVALAPFLTFALSRFLPRTRSTNQKRMLPLMLVLVTVLVFLAGNIVGLFYEYKMNSVFQYFISGFDLFDTEAGLIRNEQFVALTSAWELRPLLGYGLGASVGGIVRSSDMRWSYELSYVALLFQVGAIGVGIYGVSIIWVYVEGLKVIRNGDAMGMYMVSTLVGTSCFLLANAVDPYLDKFDYLWVIFLPVCLINIAKSRPNLSCGSI